MRRTPGGSHILLIGFRGVGKTTVGRALARRLGRPFLDIDAEIERRTGRTVRALFREHGEDAFRARERQVLREIACHAPLVVATGGGIVESAGARASLARLGLCVWLQASEAELIRRLRRSSARPALSGRSVVAEVPALLRRRRPWYRAVADVTVRCGASTPHAIALRIERRVHASDRRWTWSRGAS